MYSNQLDVTLTAWDSPPQIVVRIWGGGRGIATQEWQDTLMEEQAVPWAGQGVTFSVNSGPAPEWPPWPYIGLSVHIAPAGTTPPQHVSGPVFRSGYFATSLPTSFPTDPNGMISILEFDGSVKPITQADLDSDIAQHLSLPLKLPSQVLIRSVAVTIGEDELMAIAKGDWTAPGPPIADGSTQQFTYSVNVSLVSSMSMYPDTSEVVLVATAGNGSLSFDVKPPTDPFFANTTVSLILKVLSPFITSMVTPQLAKTLTTRLNSFFLENAGQLFGLPAGTPLPAGVVLSLERVTMHAQTTDHAKAGISPVVAAGCFGQLKDKFLPPPPPPPPPQLRTPTIVVTPFPVPMGKFETINVQARDPIDGTVIIGTTTILQPSVHSGRVRFDPVATFNVPGLHTVNIQSVFGDGDTQYPHGHFVPERVSEYKEVDYALVLES